MSIPRPGLAAPFAAPFGLCAALLAGLLGLAPPARGLEAPGPTLTLERIFADPPLDGRAPVALQLSPGGRLVTFLKPNERDSEILDLWGAELPGGAPRLLVGSADLLGGRAQRLTEQERMALERKRISKRGITSYLWCGKDARTLLLPFSGDLYAAFLGDGVGDDGGSGVAPTIVRLTNDEEEPELSPSCSKSGKRVAFVKRGDVHVLDIPDPSLRKPSIAKAKKLTQGGGATRSFGLAEFIAEEEMGRHQGMWWAPDERSLLVFEVDEAKVGVKVRAQIFSDRTELVEQRYPAAGETNAVVTAWLVDVASGKKVRLQAPTEDGYLPRAGFFPDGRPWLQWQSRDQRRLKLFEANPQGLLRPILEETDEAWVELHDDLFPLADGKRFLWTSEQSGRRQIAIVDRQSGRSAPLTQEPEPVESILAVDEENARVFFAAYRDRGRQLHVFSIPLAGGASSPVAAEPGWHAAVFDDAGRFFVDKRSDLGRPPRTSIRDGGGKEVFLVDENLAAELATFARAQPRWLDVKAEDGTLLNGLLFSPRNIEKGKRYPVITLIYGGPTAITVRRAWHRQDPVITHWTHRGFGVFLLDNRGMGGRDRAFGRAHHRRIGDVEVKDLFAGVEQLKAQVPWVDGRRIGVFGWSYGGFLAARAVLDEASPFAAAAAVAPVTDWSLYDTHYTERYLGMPRAPVEGGGEAQEAEPYARANLVSRAALLARPLLLVHGTADDNVLFEHTLRLTEALEKEAKLFELMIYPGKAHGISGKPAQLHVFMTLTSFFEARLR
jgi:dipeptidyl-peptidase 4